MENINPREENPIVRDWQAECEANLRKFDRFRTVDDPSLPPRVPPTKEEMARLYRSLSPSNPFRNPPQP